MLGFLIHIIPILISYQSNHFALQKLYRILANHYLFSDFS